MAKLDPDIINAALIGYQQELERIKGKIADLQRQLGRRSEAAPAPAHARPARKHHVSAEGRARIAAAQRKRWAAAKRQQTQSARG
jgi:hypothetical protein